MDELLTRTALEQSRRVRAGDVSVTELTRAALDRIARLDARYNAFVEVAHRQATAQAAALERGRRDARGPLWGVVTAMKDLHMTRGMRVRLGSRAFRHLWSPVDDLTSAAVRRAGMVIAGKLGTSELGILPVVHTALGPPTRNPWDPSRYSGGSSGGSSASVASAMTAVAAASDGAGSIRIPAAFCGLVGHKPTRGMVPNPHAPFDAVGLSVLGPHARSVDDAAALLDVLMGDLRPRGHLLDAVARPPARMRVRVTTDNPLVRSDAAAERAVQAVTRALEAMGHTVERGPAVEGTLEEFLPMFTYLAGAMLVPGEGGLEDTTRWLRARGRRVTRAEALACRDRFRAKIDRWFGDASLWVSPTVAVPPPEVGCWDGLDGEGRFRAAAPLGAFTAAFNASGHPATTVPVWLEGERVPRGVQLVAPRGEDVRALATARAVMEALGTPVCPVAPDAR